MSVEDLAKKMMLAALPYVSPIWAQDIANNLAGAVEEGMITEAVIKKSICRRIGFFGMPCVDIDKCAASMFEASKG